MNPKDLVGAKKAPMDLVPAAGAIMSAPAHKNGADKYGPFNWRANPVQLMTYLAAIRRHMDAFIDGQDLAEDTGIHHLSHMQAGMNIIADALALGNLIDNRPPKGPAADMLRAQDHSEVVIIRSAELPTEAEVAEARRTLDGRSGFLAESDDPGDTFRSFVVKPPDGYCPDCGQPVLEHSHLITCPAYGS